jgi:hypothetical protein
MGIDVYLQPLIKELQEL